jgi:hypothetical protein
VTLDELMSQLLSAHDAFTTQLAVEVREQEERDARNAVKIEQDLAFEMAQQVSAELGFCPLYIECLRFCPHAHVYV